MDEIIGKRSIEVSDLQNFKYLNAVLRETARLSPTVPVLQKHVNPAIAHEVVTLDNGRYRIDPNDHIILLMAKCQTDPKVWGENADDFIPERMLDENFDKVMADYPGAWKVSCPVCTPSKLQADLELALWKRKASLHWPSVRLARGTSCAGNDFAEL